MHVLVPKQGRVVKRPASWCRRPVAGRWSVRQNISTVQINVARDSLIACSWAYTPSFDASGEECWQLRYRLAEPLTIRLMAIRRILSVLLTLNRPLSAVLSVELCPSGHRGKPVVVIAMRRD